MYKLVLQNIILKIYKYIHSFPFPQKWLEESTNKFLLEENISFEKPWYLEYNTDTSAQHPEMGDDIVRPIWKHIELKDKEPLG